MTRNPGFTDIKFGAAYYPEYQPTRSYVEDLDLMVQAGFSVIRVGESVWSTWEPRNGVFDLEWLAPVLDAAHERGIAVILGTPTYAVPPWLQVLHPEIALRRRDGSAVGWGSRQEADQSHPAYRWFAERVTRQVVGRYADHPAVIGFQVDNEPGDQLVHNDSTFARFIDWLRDRYGSVQALNDDWGLVYWSHRITEWTQLWRPDGNKMPQYTIEWRRFQAALATDLVSWLAEIVREYARDDQFVTTCISYPRPQIADDLLVADLDITAGNPYYLMQEGLTAERELPRTEEWWHTGPWALFKWGDRAYSSAQQRFLVTETNAQSIGQAWQNHPPYPGQLRQAAFALIARGARMIEYWHWQTTHHGLEAHWGGVLPHSRRPGRVYYEIAHLGAELRSLGDRLDALEPDADVLMLHSTETAWLWEEYPPFADARGEADPTSYRRAVDPFYRGLVETGAQVRFQHARQFVDADPVATARRYPVLVAVAEYVACDGELDALRAYAHAGGHLVLGVRTGYADGLARSRAEVAPARLAAAAGVWYDEYTNLDAPWPVSGTIDLEAGSAGELWADVLNVDDAETLVAFARNELGAHSAVTTCAHGAGRITYVATVPNAPLARSLARWLVPDPIAGRWSVSDAVSVMSGSRGSERIFFVHNWSGEAATLTLPHDVRHLESGDAVAAGFTFPLGPRSVILFASVDPEVATPRPHQEKE
ncbi:beta-galactosidase [Microbacterium gorillae]|uniref:beta-galactosidase n=1 Tax=Microbacterium gorillae TaxID=1231063 RepID=UPI00058B00E8|nr:beta-galactosidase [Microbacterium gorillae]